MCDEAELVLVGNIPTGPGPAEQSGLVEVVTLSEKDGSTQIWKLTPQALVSARDLEKRLDRMVRQVAQSGDLQRRYYGALSLMTSIGCQDDRDGLLIAMDHAGDALGDVLKRDPVFDRAAALGEELEPAFVFDDPHGELAFPRLAFAIARLEDPLLTERCLTAAVTRIREGEFDLDEMAAFIEALRP